MRVSMPSLVGPRMAVVAAAALVLGSLTIPVRAETGEHQMARGSVTAPTGTGMVGPVWTGACELGNVAVAITTGIDDLLAYEFSVDPATHGQPFELVPDRPADIDIVFVAGHARVAFDGDGLSGERGTVPTGARRATVCLVAGTTAKFTYTAGPSLASSRRIEMAYLSGTDPVAHGLALWTANRRLPACVHPEGPGIGGVCVLLDAGDGALRLSVLDASGRTVSGDIHFLDGSAGRVDRQPFCHRITASVPPGAVAAIITLDVSVIGCGLDWGPATAGIVVADLS